MKHIEDCYLFTEQAGELKCPFSNYEGSFRSCLGKKCAAWMIDIEVDGQGRCGRISIGTPQALNNISEALYKLGTNNADTEMGAIELLSKEVMNGLDKVSSSLDYIADSLKK